jgi:tetratricopeptide (TPR) repeat protein
VDDGQDLLTLTAMNNLALTLRAQGDLAGARALQERALAVRRRVLGDEHPDTLTAMNNLAGTLSAQGDLACARALEERALDVRRRVLGDEHPATLTAMNNLAGTLSAQGDLAGARALEERVLGVRRRVLGDEHPDTLRGLNDHAHQLRKGGLPALAEPVARKVVKTTLQTLGIDHPLTVHRRNNLALTLLMLDRADEARRLLAENWHVPSPRYSNLTPCIPYLALLADMLSKDTATTNQIGRLKTLLCGPELPRTPDIAHPWDVAYLLDYLRPKLPPNGHEFLAALLAAINDPIQAPELDRFPEWRDTPPVPLEAPWADAPPPKPRT